jgi:hypothetical protein
MAASLPAMMAMIIFFAALFYVFIPDVFFNFSPTKTTSSDSKDVRMTHAVLFAVTLAVSYEFVANYIHKAL